MRAAALCRGNVFARVLPAALLFSAVAAPPARAQGTAVEQFERTVPLASGGTFSLSNVNGSIEIEGWDRDQVEISARKFTTGAQDDLRQVAIEVTSSSGSVSVATHYPEGSGVEVNVEFHVRVPARIHLSSVSTVNGSVTVQDVSGDGSLAAINGNVMLSRGAGIFSARTTNGNVSLEFLSFEGGLAAFGDSGRPVSRGGISAQTVNGSVVVALPADAGAELEARTQNGDFSSDLPLLAHTSAAGRNIRGRVGSGGPPLFVRTVNGSIRLRIARPLV
jgi:DUF4097 and DUF4098 domain-containing protein YvlB